MYCQMQNIEDKDHCCNKQESIGINSYHFPGGHTPTEQEVKTWYATLAQKILMEYSMKEDSSAT